MGIRTRDPQPTDKRAPSQSYGVARRNIAISATNSLPARPTLTYRARRHDGRARLGQPVADPSLGTSLERSDHRQGQGDCRHDRRDRFKNDVCFISAHDVNTGKELWRTATVARPGEPGGDTWGELPLLLRAGADAWIPGSYDAATNTVFWSTSQAAS